MRLLCLAGAVWLVGYAVATALVANSHMGQLILGDVAYHVPLLAAAVAAFVAASRLTGRMRRFWRVIGISLGLMAVGEAIWSAYEILGSEAPTPSWADLFFFLGSFMAIPAVFVGFGGASSDRRNRAWLDAAIVMIGAGAVGWRLLIAPQLTGGFTFAVASQIAYPLLDIALVVVLVALGFGGHRKVPAPLALVGLAYAVAVLGDTVYSYATIHGIFESGGWIDLTWQIQFVLLAIAAVAAGRLRAPEAQVAAMDRDFGQVPMFLGAALIVLLAGVDLHHINASMTILALGGMVAALLRRYQLTARDLRSTGFQLRIAADEQTRLATTDDLTALYNRRFIVEALREALADGAAHGCVALLELDIDHFKHINDTHGHDAGDAVLVEVAARLTRCVRGNDVVARYGGEEFVVMLRIADPDQLAFVAERWRTAVAEGPILLPNGAQANPTVSVGGAWARPGQSTLDELFLAADRALYEAKAAGRNRVALSGRVYAA